jgi:hypothetical protein
MGPNSIQKSALGNLTKLGYGAQGNVFNAPRAQLILQGKPFGEAAYKEYRADKINEVDVSILREMVAFLSSLPFTDGANLIARAAWPACLVEERSKIAGFLMPRIPSHFLINNFRLPSGKTKQVNAEFQHLLNDAKLLSAHGITLTDNIRYKLLHALAASLEFFHGYRIAVGDLSSRNVLFSLSPKQSVYFIDCDSMNFCGEFVLPQVETTDWDIRAVSPSEDLGTIQTDRYKFGLFVLRLFTGHQTTRDHTKLPSRVPDQLCSLVRRSLSANAHSRPDMSKWLKPLEDATMSTGATVTPHQTQPPPRTVKSPNNRWTILKTKLKEALIGGLDPFNLLRR